MLRHLKFLRLPRRFVRDERAQAMTEYVIVVPAVLLMFFAAMQLMWIAQAAQLANYAAFNAARTYATSYSLYKKQRPNDNAHDECMKKAEDAALLVMAPVSRAVHGEALFIWNGIRGVVNGLGAVGRIYALGEGFAVAKIWRLKNFEISQPSSGDTNAKSTITASFDYMFPVTIPGLQEMWNYFLYDRPAGSSIADTMLSRFEVGLPIEDQQDLTDALNQIRDVLGLLDTFTGGSTGAQLSNDMDTQIVDLYNNVGLLGAPVNIRIKAKCDMGFEPWYGKAIDDGAHGAFDIDPAVQQCLDDINEMMESNQEQQEKTEKECKEADVARANYEVASNAYVQAVANFNQKDQVYQDCVSANGALNCGSELSARAQASNDMNDAKDEHDQKLLIFNIEMGECEDEQENSQNQQGNTENFDCGL